MNESVNQEPESFIVQNVTLGPHYVSDIRLNFGPLQAIDLTWEDPKIVKASKDLIPTVFAVCLSRKERSRNCHEKQQPKIIRLAADKSLFSVKTLPCP